MTEKTIIWHSRTCACSFVLAFDYGPGAAPTHTREYRLVSWGPSEEHLERSHEDYPDCACVARTRDACPEHAALDVAAAYAAVCGAHVDAGWRDDYRKITVNAWTLECGCVVEKQFHREMADAAHVIRPEVRRCDAHQKLGGAMLFEQVKRESLEKVRVLNALRQTLPQEEFVRTAYGARLFLADQDPVAAATLRVLLPVEVGWREEPQLSYAEDRSLIVDLPENAPAEALSAVQASVTKIETKTQRRR